MLHFVYILIIIVLSIVIIRNSIRYKYRKRNWRRIYNDKMKQFRKDIQKLTWERDGNAIELRNYKDYMYRNNVRLFNEKIKTKLDRIKELESQLDTLNDKYINLNEDCQMLNIIIQHQKDKIKLFETVIDLKKS